MLDRFRPSVWVLAFAAIVLGGASCSSGKSGGGTGATQGTGGTATGGASSSSSGASSSSGTGTGGSTSSSSGGCSDSCTTGATRCAGSQVQTCGTQGDGCLEWSAPADCPTNQTCLGTQCVLACSNKCISGDTQCNAGQLQTCAKQSDGCTDWNPATACPSGETCSGGVCATSCTNQCAVGATQCSGPELTTCATQTNGCTDWNPATACPNGTCSAGMCCVNACTLDATQCSGTQVETCTTQTNGCTDWSAAAACPNNGMCLGTACCTNNCTAGATQCSGTQVQTCAVQASGCLDWGTATACPTSEMCVGSACVGAGCTPGALQCNGTILQVCSSAMMWQTQQVCSQSCDPVNKVCTTSGVTCTAQAQRCAGNVVEVCNSTGTAWLEVETCLGTCTAGACTGACTPGSTQCNGNVPETCNAAGTAWTSGTACTTSCIAGACSSPTLVINANANATINGVVYVDGDVSITNGSVLTVPSGTTTIYCDNFTLDSTSQIVVTPTGNDPRGTGGPAGTSCTGCYGSYCCNNYANDPASGGSYGTAGTGSSESSCYLGYPTYQDAYCYPGGQPAPTYAIADNEAATGAAGGTCPGSTPGMGGGLIAVYCNNITIAGTITANGGSATGCAGGGSGGGVVLRAPGTLTFSGSISVAGGNGGAGSSPYAGGGNGGYGVVKLLYGNTDTLTGTIIGQTSFKSFMPPFDVSSATHPNPARWYNDGFPAFDLAWSQPFTNTAGFYYALNTTYGFVPTPANAMFLGGEALSFTPSALVAGANDLHVDTVGPFANVGTVEARYKVQINATPPTIASSSHPSQTTWYANNSPYFTWTLPHAAADVTNFYWVFDPYATTIPDTTATQIPMNQMTPQNSEQLLLPNQANGIWFFHVMAQDTMGYLTKAGASYRVQLGAAPMQGSVSGSVTDAVTHNPLSGVTVTLNRGVLTTTTAANGTYAFPSTVYDQGYEARASLTGYKDSVQMITVTGTMTTTANFQMGM